MQQVEVIDKFGRVRFIRRGESLADGEHLRVPLMFMDAATRAAHDALAQRFGLSDSQPTRGYKRGYQTFDATPPRSSQDEAALAYEEKRARYGSRRREVVGAADAPVQCADAAQARALADAAYRDKCARLACAWRR